MLPEYNAIGKKKFEAMSGVKLTKIAKKSEQISHFIDSSSLTDRGWFLESSKYKLSYYTLPPPDRRVSIYNPSARNASLYIVGGKPFVSRRIGLL